MLVTNASSSVTTGSIWDEIDAIDHEGAATKALAEQTFEATQPDGKTRLTITRDNRPANSDTLNFRISLQGERAEGYKSFEQWNLQGRGSVREDTAKTIDESVIVSTTIRTEDFDHADGKSSLICAEIELGDEMRGSGVSAALHYAIARSAQDLNIENYVLSPVVSDGGHSLARRLEMESVANGSGYAISIDKLLDVVDRQSNHAGWSTSQLNNLTPVPEMPKNLQVAPRT